ncbi:MAG: GTPase [Polyangiales bacterium]
MKKSPEKKPVDPRKTGASPAGPSAGKPPSAPKTSGDPWLVTAAEFVIEARDAAQLPAPTVSEVAFAGRSNVGKSTLLNALAQRKGWRGPPRRRGARAGSSCSTCAQRKVPSARRPPGLRLRALAGATRSATGAR